MAFFSMEKPQEPSSVLKGREREREKALLWVYGPQNNYFN